MNFNIIFDNYILPMIAEKQLISDNYKNIVTTMKTKLLFWAPDFLEFFCCFSITCLDRCILWFCLPALSNLPELLFT